MSQRSGERRVVAGRYVLGEMRGRGGMGTVWAAEDELLGRSVAIKEIVVPDAVPEDERATTHARMLREARAAARLNHHGVVTVHDIVSDADRIGIVMELVLAPTLAEIVDGQGPLPPGRVARIGLQLLEALEAAHDAGIVHRDLKPSNVMVLPRDRVKLTDFGIASIRGDPQLTSSGIVLGSPAFMAPEQVSGGTRGPALDLWGLGATMYYAVEGRLPFVRSEQQALLAAILTQDPEPMRLAGPLAPVLAGLLVKDPDERPSGSLLRQALEHAVASDAHEITVADPAVLASAASRPGQPSVPLAAPGIETAAVTGSAAMPSTAASPATAGPSAVTGAVPPMAGGPGPAPSPGSGPHTPVRWPTKRSNRVRLAIGGGIVVAVAAIAGLVWAAGLVPSGGAGSQASGRTGGGEAAGETPVASSGTSRTTLGSTAANPADGGAAPAGSGLGASDPAPVTLRATREAPPGQTLPERWLSVTNQAGGYRLGVPASFWDVAAEGSTTYVEWRGEETFRAAFEVRAYDRSQDPYALLQHESDEFAKAHRQDRYKLIKLTPSWTYKREPASAWEFTWVRNDKLTHARVVAFRAGSRTYTILYRSNDVFWYGGGSADFPDGFEQAFTPVG